MNFRTVVMLALMPALVTLPAAATIVDPVLQGKLLQYADLPTNLQLEGLVADSVEKGDIAALKQKAAEVEASDGAALKELGAMADALRAKIEAKDESWKTDPALAIAVTMGPCELAGLGLRRIILQIADGSVQPVFRHGTVMVDKSETDTRLSGDLTMCERVHNARQVEQITRRIGTMCYATGVDCDKDPDM